MRESLGSEGIWTHGLGGGRRRDLEDAGVDREWRPADVASRVTVNVLSVLSV